ncbi:MAG TPA: hypothetical protein PLK80_10085 [bacterium]|nr:hypothetical protein [bacterium]HPI77073.1 hypothetical protein [bacterium]HPN94318.1 hypothetical protein [bacterium]
MHASSNRKRAIVVTYWHRPETNSPRAHHTEGIISSLRACGVEVDSVFPLLPGVQYDTHEDKGLREHPVKPGFFLHKSKYTKSGPEKSGKSGVKAKILRWANKHLLWPDRTIEFSIMALRYIENNLVPASADCIVTVGLPLSCHIVGSRLKRKYPEIRWTADYGDPYTFASGENAFKRKDKVLESRMLKNVDAVTIPVEDVKWCYERLGVATKSLHVIPQLYTTDIAATTEYDVDVGAFNVACIGTLYCDNSELQEFVSALSILRKSGILVVFHMFGLIGPFRDAMRELGEEMNPCEWRLTDYLPRKELGAILRKMDALICFTTKKAHGAGQRPSRYIEYVYSGRPFFNIGPGIKGFPNAACDRNEIASILASIHNGVFHFDYSRLLKEFDFKTNSGRMADIITGNERN